MTYLPVFMTPYYVDIYTQIHLRNSMPDVSILGVDGGTITEYVFNKDPMRVCLLRHALIGIANSN